MGAILADILSGGFEVTAMKYIRLTQTQAEAFYGIHKERPFFGELVQYMISGPVVVAILKCENAVEAFRKIIGATDPAKAEEGTIRKKYGIDLSANAIHGSDSDENANIEGNFFFSQCERFFIT